MKITYVLTIATALMFATVCAANDADEGLEKTLRAAIAERHVHIDVDKGVVKIEGRVRTEADRQRIDTFVRHTPGVAAVKNELKVELPSPGASGGARSSIPVYSTAPPEVTVNPPETVVVSPAPVIVPEYPKLKVQARTAEDLSVANRIAHQLQVDALPATGLDNVVIKVRSGTVSLTGTVAGREERDAIIASVQRAGGMTAIYDQLRVR